MKKYSFQLLIFGLLMTPVLSHAQDVSIRPWKDPVGFATQAWQVDSIIARNNRMLGVTIPAQQFASARFAICPHDDFTYAGAFYQETFSKIRAKTIILIGVAHKAKKFQVEEKIVFDGFDYWEGIYGPVKVSSLRNEIISLLPIHDYSINDSLQSEEHSLEAMIPFIHYYGKKTQIVPILIPHMPFEKMKQLSKELAEAIYTVMKSHNMSWGADYSIVVSSDAVHYGDEDWGGQNYAPFGCDSSGYKQAMVKEDSIVNQCFKNISAESAAKFFNYTVSSSDWHNYQWTWCGRYSVPFALLMVAELKTLTKSPDLRRTVSKYANSINHKPIPVKDLGMDATAPANLHHWVGYYLGIYF